MGPFASPLRTCLTLLLLFPAAALAHGSEIFVISWALQVILVIALLIALIASQLSARRKLLVGGAYALGVLAGWVIYLVAQPSVTTVFTIPVLLPPAAAIMVFRKLRQRRDAQEHA